MSFALLYTDEIRLRALEPSDVDVLMRLENDEELWENGIVTGPFSRFQLERYIAENTNDIYVDGQLRLVIEHCSGSVAGVIDLCTFDARHSRAEVGIVVLKEFRRRGLPVPPYRCWNGMLQSVGYASIVCLCEDKQCRMYQSLPFCRI